jgi:hypothetical protein
VAPGRLCTASRDSLLVISDHGQIDRGGQDPIALREPFVLAGAGVRPEHYGDIEMVDVAPTVAALLGASLPASSQGHARIEMLDQPPAREAAIRNAGAAQQARLAAAYADAIGREVAVAPSDDAVGSTQSAMAEARAARLNAERLPRAALALVLALVSAVLLFRRRRRTAGWLLGGALVYVALFHLWYLELAGWSYSLSSVTGEAELLLTVGSGALPVLLGYAANGLLVTWIRPACVIVFAGFLSALQALFVAIGGLVLARVAAAIAWAIGQVHRAAPA